MDVDYHSPPDPPPNCEPEDQAPQGHPVSAYSGQWWERQVDLVVPGVIPIRMERKYQSRSTYDTPLGYGWSFEDYDARVFKYPDGSVVMRRGCGDRLSFAPTGGAFTNPPLIRGKLLENPDGSHTFTLPAGTKHNFDNQGRLASIEDSRGNRLEMIYGSDKLPLTGTSPFAVEPATPMVVAYFYQLTQIRERTADGNLTGRFVDLSYSESTGRLVSVQSHDQRTVRYDHDSNGNLIQVDGLEGITTTYDHDDPADVHNVTSYESGGIRPITNFYLNDRKRLANPVSPPG